MAQEPDFVTSSGEAADVPPEAARIERDIERDIERTRAEMSETIDAIGARFQPAYIKEQAKDALRDTARDAGTSMIDTLRDNPLPAAIAGLSIAWLVANGGRSSRRDDVRAYRSGYGPRSGSGYSGYDDGRGYGPGRGYDRYGAPDYGATGYGAGSEPGGPSLGDRAGQALHGVRDTAGETLDTVRERAADLGGHVTDTAHDVQEQAGVYGRRAATWLEDQMHQNPLGVGAVALAAGALVGLALPGTDAENELMGRQSQAVARQASEVASEKMEQVKQVASTVMDDVEEKAGEVVEHARAEAQDLSSGAASASGGASGGGSGSSLSSPASTGGSSASVRPASTVGGSTEHVANVNHPDDDTSTSGTTGSSSGSSRV